MFASSRTLIAASKVFIKIGYYGLFCILLFAWHNGTANPLLEKQRGLYVKTEQALKRGQRTLFLQQQDSMINYPLYPYLLYQDLANRMARIKLETVIDFLTSYDGTPVADKLRHQWLKHLAARNNWQLFAQHYRTNAYYEDKTLACFYAQSLLHTRRLDELRDLIKQLWLVNFSQPPECDAVFQWGRETQVIDQDLIWQRILLVVESGRIRLANYLAAQLDSDARKWYALLKQSYYRPFATLEKIANHSQHSRFLHQVLLYNLSRARREDLHKAHILWQNMKQHFKNYPVYEEVQIELGVAACRELEPEIGLQYSYSLANVTNDKSVHHWHIRCALRLRKWKAVLKAIAALDNQERESTRWLYWKARAYERLGNAKGASAIWKSIASEASYYGYLAADRIGTAYALSTELPKIELQTMNKVRDLAATRRVHEFLSLARVFDARRELFYLLPLMSKDERIGIALLCRQWDSAICTIEALANPIFWHKELELRFPMPYRELIAEQARRVNLTEHWLYAVMRRESAFIADIKSPAGALGLMQLMPTTARRVASRLGLNYASTWSLLQPKLNMRLGSYYLRQLHGLNDGDWAATLASYNAGHHRVKQWKQQAPIYDADIWIETIPITETRRYVRAVLFYAVVYHYKLHQKTMRLKAITRRLMR